MKAEPADSVADTGHIRDRSVPEVGIIVAPRHGLAAIRYRFWSFPMLSLLMLVLVGCNPEQYPQTTLLPGGDFARIADDLLDTTVKWAILVFVLVEGVLVYAIFRFRGKAGDPEAHQTHGNTLVEIICTDAKPWRDRRGGTRPGRLSARPAVRLVAHTNWAAATSKNWSAQYVSTSLFVGSRPDVLRPCGCDPVG